MQNCDEDGVEQSTFSDVVLWLYHKYHILSFSYFFDYLIIVPHPHNLFQDIDFGQRKSRLI